jgi:hypothetical protein
MKYTILSIFAITLSLALVPTIGASNVFADHEVTDEETSSEPKQNPQGKDTGLNEQTTTTTTTSCNSDSQHFDGTQCRNNAGNPNNSPFSSETTTECDVVNKDGKVVPGQNKGDRGC